jgi:hypothetical protein
MAGLDAGFPAEIASTLGKLATGGLLFHLLALVRLYDAGSPQPDDLATSCWRSDRQNG